MRIFKDIFTGAECLCDNDRPLPEDGCMYRVEGKMIEIGGEDYGLAANVDEDADEGATAEAGEAKKEKVVDLVHNNRLMETSFDKASYMAYIKSYMKTVMASLKEGGASDDDCKAFAGQAQTFVKKVVGDIDEFQFFYPDMGDDGDFDASMVVLCRWEEEKPIFYYWKHGLKGEKV